MESTAELIALGAIFISVGLVAIFASDTIWKMHEISLAFRGIKPARTTLWDIKRIASGIALSLLGFGLVIAATMPMSAGETVFLLVIALFLMASGAARVFARNLVWRLHRRRPDVQNTTATRTGEWDDRQEAIGIISLILGLGIGAATICAAASNYT